MQPVVVAAPTRIDLAGGTLDLWPLHCSLDHKLTVNVAVTLNASVKIEKSINGKFEFDCIDLNKNESGSYSEMCKSNELPLFGLLLSHYWDSKLPPIKITSKAKSPAGAGLGGSSCLAVTMGKALWEAKQRILASGLELSESKLVQTSQDIESRLISAPTGCQDYWGAVRGGVNIIRFPYGGVEVETLNSEQMGDQLNKKLIICYSGKSRASAINNWDIFKKFFDRDLETISNFNRIGKIAELCGEALINRDLESALSLSSKEWEMRKEIWPAIETFETKRIDSAAIEAGAKFTRVCGAGGGGVMAIFSDAADREGVCEAVSKSGGEILEAQVSNTGLTVTDSDFV